jgi:proline dehydrogenase
MRRALLWASTHPVLAERLPRRAFMRRAVRRFMPGEAAADALREGGRLHADGVPTLVTCLGENVASAVEARRVADRYRALGAAIRDQGLDMELSVKPSHLGLERGRAVAETLLVEVIRAARGVVWLDMEDSSTVDATLHLFRHAAEAAPGRVGICLQAYLHRTPDDLEALRPLAPHVRLVKGAYREPAGVALQRGSEVDRAYARLARRLLQARAAGACGRVGLGTHDAALVRSAAEHAATLALSAGTDWEVEMLYGIGVQAQRRLTRTGVPLRVLISYGTHWFPWYMRRLAERPANVGFVVRQLVSGAFSREAT